MLRNVALHEGSIHCRRALVKTQRITPVDVRLSRYTAPGSFAAECRYLIAAARHAQEVATQASADLAGTLRIGVVTSALSEPLLGTSYPATESRNR
jgi:hypothetical protein